MFCKQYKMKLIAASLGLVASVHANAALGGLQVQSRLNEPFSATVVVTGDEARALAGSAKPTINGANLNATVTHQGSDRAVIRLRSSAPIKEPVMTFWLGVGNQNHQYTAMLDPRDYQQPGASNHQHRERRAEAEPSRRRNSRHQERASSRRDAPVQIQGRSYQIKDGELLVDIAEQVKPSGLTLRQTINALVAANPRAFRNGNPDLMYRGATLTIPDAETLRRLAHNPPRRVSTAHDRAAAENAPANQAPATTPAAPVETKPATPAQQPVTPPPAPVEPAQPTQQQPAMPPAASEPAAELSASPAMPADQTEVLASMPEQASDMMVSEPAVEPTPPVVAPPVVETPPMEEEGMDLVQMATYGAGGLLVLGGLAYLLMNRRRKGAASGAAQAAADEDDDDLYFESVTDHSDSLAATPIASAAPAPQAAPAAPVAEQAPVSEQDLGLDLSHLDEQQQLGSTPNTEAAAQEAEADDWSWLAQAEEEPAAPAQQAAAPAVETPAATEDEWLNFGSEDPADVSAPVEAAPAVAQAEAAADDLDWVLDETPAAVPPQSFQTEPTPTVEFEVPAQPEAPAVEDTVLSFEMPELDSGSQHQEEAPAASNVMDFNMDFDSTPSAPAAEPAVAPVVESQPAAAHEEPAVAGPLPKEALEAKLELAKMYLEIDDANTARQTLLELINESEGSSIQAQAQALLNDIGH